LTLIVIQDHLEITAAFATSLARSLSGTEVVSRVNRSTFHQRVKPSAPTDQEIRRLLLTDAFGKIHGDSRGTYGYRRVTATLRIESGLIVNHKLVASIMQQLQVHGLPKRRSGKRNLIAVRTTSDLVNRDFSTTGPNQLWVTDITEHPGSTPLFGPG
jgi:transposase InsO family protein